MMNIINDVLVDKLFKDPPKMTKEIPLLSEKTVSGDGMVIINDAYSDFPITNLTLRGNTEQPSTTGAQLFDADRMNGITKSGVTISVKDGMIKATGMATKDEWIRAYVSVEEYKKIFKPGEKIFIKSYKTTDCNYDFGLYGAHGSPILGTVTERNSQPNGVLLPTIYPAIDTDFYFFVSVKQGVTLKGSLQPMVYQMGNGIYEPYTGGKPSPSPDYPQEIKNVGKWNEETQKYEVDVKVTNVEQDWDKEQSLTITSDRPITKWDKLVEQDGQIGWLYKSRIAEIPKTGYALKNTNENRYGVYFSKSSIFKDAVVTKGSPEKDSNIFTHFKLGNPYASNGNIAWLYVAGSNTDLRIKVDDETINTVELFEQYISDKDIQILYETESTEFVPLPLSEQNTIRALTTYYPTTVVTVDGGELPVGIEVTYMKPEYIPTKQSALRMWFKENPII